MDQNDRNIIHQIHEAAIQAVLVVSGGGSQSLAWLMGMPGATKTILEVTFPYSYASFERFIGFQPESYVSQDTAIVMAKVAYRRARLLAPEGTPAVGVACTAALITDRPKRGDHRCHVAVRDEQGVTAYSLVLAKGQRDRVGEENVVSRLIIQALAAAGGCPELPDLGLLPGEQVITTRYDEVDEVLRVLRGDLDAVVIDINGQLTIDLPHDVVVLPGAFNPLHGGHLQLAHVASQMTGRQVFFELSLHNVDKPPLLEADVRQRLEQFYGRGAIVVTAAPLFEQKAALLPGSVFVIGYDTASRLVSPRYYGNSEPAMLASLAVVRAAGCSFLVAGRLVGEHFQTLTQVAVPPEFTDLFRAIPPDVFRVDISSTDLRQQFIKSYSVTK